jgi:glycosyltransferase involved in cell wall biosynthesis
MIKQTDNSVDVSIVIACYNDAPHLKKNFKKIVDVMDRTRYIYEIIFVEDKSKDDSRKVIEEIVAEYPAMNIGAIFHETNMGRGRSVTDGFLQSRGRAMGFLDIDLEVHARYIPSAVLAVEQGADLVIARRVFDLNYHSLGRFFISKGYIKVASKILGVIGSDSESGFKFFNKSTMLDVIRKVKDPHWFWDTEVVYRGRLENKKIIEIPALFMKQPHKASTVNIFKDIIYYLKRLFGLKKMIKKESGEKRG